MDQTKKNKEFVIEYFNAISGVTKTSELCEKYMTDQGLIEHILFFDGAFPKYEMFIDEITGEGARVIVRARIKGKHSGELNGIPATGKEVLFPFVIGYEIEKQKIISHWLIADQMMLMEQLGVMKQSV
ncbi:MAG: ester cyclase [Cyclobacteriaceae bacterium]|nr:ester cyclase [Cyclobacteriaceae bacterium]